MDFIDLMGGRMRAEHVSINLSQKSDYDAFQILLGKAECKLRNYNKKSNTFKARGHGYFGRLKVKHDSLKTEIHFCCCPWSSSRQQINANKLKIPWIRMNPNPRKNLILAKPVIITELQRSCGKVMCSQVYVIMFTMWGGISTFPQYPQDCTARIVPAGIIPPGNIPLWGHINQDHTPWDHKPLGP